MANCRWTEERERKLAELWAQDLSAAQIARLIGATRNAVIGKVHRMGLPPRPRPAPKSRPRRVRVRRWRPAVQRMCVATQAIVVSGFTPLCTLMELSRESCRFPIGEPGAPGFGFCGRPRVHGPYCAEHHRVCYQVLEQVLE
jgi:GcrA cell cycle regulator